LRLRHRRNLRGPGLGGDPFLFNLLDLRRLNRLFIRPCRGLRGGLPEGAGGAACSVSTSGACAGAVAGGGVANLITLDFASAPGSPDAGVDACCWACGAGGDGLAGGGGAETGFGGVIGLIVV